MIDDTNDIARDPAADEREVRTALAKYTDEAGKADHRDFVPTRILHRVYMEWRATASQRLDANRPPPLTLSEFGMVLRRAFPRAKRKLRQYHGPQLPGYCNLIGPLGVRSAEPICTMKHVPSQGANEKPPLVMPV